MNISKKIENSVIHITSTIGNFDWSTPLPNSPIIGENQEDIWAIYKTLEEVHMVTKNMVETLFFLGFHWKFQTNILISSVNTLRQTVERIIKSTNLLYFEDTEEQLQFERMLVKCNSYGAIPILCNSFGFDLIHTMDILSYGILNKPQFIIPTNQFSREIEAAVIMFILHKYNIIINIKDFYNGN